MRRFPILLAAAALAACAGARPRPDPHKARKDLAQELVRRGDWSEAFPVVDALHRDDPRDPEVLAMRGVIYREQKLLKEAEADLDEALKLNPDYAHAHSSLAILLDQEGRGAEALEHHRRAAQLQPLHQGYLNNLGFSLFIHGKAREAIPVLHEALRLDPTNGRIRNNLGFAYAKTGDFRAAAAQFSMGAAPAEARNNLGFAYQLNGNPAQAYQAYVEAVRLDPAARRPRQNLAEVSRQLGRAVPADLPADSGASPQRR